MRTVERQVKRKEIISIWVRIVILMMSAPVPSDNAQHCKVIKGGTNRKLGGRGSKYFCISLDIFHTLRI